MVYIGDEQAASAAYIGDEPAGKQGHYATTLLHSQPGDHLPPRACVNMYYPNNHAHEAAQCVPQPGDVVPMYPNNHAPIYPTRQYIQRGCAIYPTRQYIQPANHLPIVIEAAQCVRQYIQPGDVAPMYPNHAPQSKMYPNQRCTPIKDGVHRTPTPCACNAEFVTALVQLVTTASCSYNPTWRRHRRATRREIIDARKSSTLLPPRRRAVRRGMNRAYVPPCYHADEEDEDEEYAPPGDHRDEEDEEDEGPALGHYYQTASVYNAKAAHVYDDQPDYGYTNLNAVDAYGNPAQGNGVHCNRYREFPVQPATVHQRIWSERILSDTVRRYVIAGVVVLAVLIVIVLIVTEIMEQLGYFGVHEPRRAPAGAAERIKILRDRGELYQPPRLKGFLSPVQESEELGTMRL